MQENKKWIILVLFLGTGLIFIIRLMFIQVLDDTYQLRANKISVKSIDLYPHRGIIVDRNGKELVVNIPIYDLMVLPDQVALQDTLALCNLLKIEIEDFRKRFTKAAKYSKFKPSVFLKQISREDFHRLQDLLIDYPGFYISSRTMRHYPHQSAAHALGYIGEISENQLERDSTRYYKQGDYVGISGIEAAYELELRGQKGVRHVWVDPFGREKGEFKDGQFDTLSIAGQNLICTIDLDLQKYGEALMQNKKGAVVAIEPSSGEILSLISAPTYDPNLLSGGELSRNYGNLLMDEHKPLFNRAIRAKYPPGSTFKTIQALIALQENYVNDETVFACNKNLVKCHFHPTANLHRSIQHSCNPYYYQVYRRIIYQRQLKNVDTSGAYTLTPDGDYREGFNKWRNYLLNFNLGKKTGVDLANELDGLLPNLKLYDDRYGKGNWQYSNIYSLSIGQGEIGVLPIQLANLAATLANRGHYYAPHLIKGIGESGEKRAEYTIKHEIPIKKEHFEKVVAGMQDGYKAGTVAYYAIIPDLEICSKTGTAQNPHGEDHSVFIAFAPRNNPKIAIAVYVENAGFGGTWAAPVAALMIEKYLKGEISNEWTEDYVLNKRFIEEEILEETPQILVEDPETAPADTSANKKIALNP